jgi:hypothetical protein
MSKYTQQVRPAPIKREVHPIWRGIGLFFAIIIPAMAYAATLLLLEENKIRGWMAIPKDVLVTFGSDPLLGVKIALTLFLAVVIYGIFSMISFILYSAFAPPRLGPFDAPPIRKRVKPYKR